MKLLILGGGLSGLLVARHLERAGHAVEVWEAEAAPGGFVRTTAWEGPAGEPGSIECGPQVLRVRSGSGLDRLLQELGLPGQVLRSRGPRWIGKAGGRHPRPTSVLGLLRCPGMRFAEVLRLLCEPFAPQAPEDESLAQWAARRLGHGFARESFPALVASLLAAPPEALGVDALPRIKALEAQGGLLRAAWGQGREQRFLPEGGVGALTVALARGLRVQCGRRALSLERAGAGWKVHAEGLETQADAVVMALPHRETVRLLRPLAPEAAKRLDEIPLLDLRVWHSRHAPVPGWHQGFALHVHPPEGRGLLGALSLAANDPRGIPGLMQVRSYVGGAFPVAPALEAWDGVEAELRRWLPELPPAVQVREARGTMPLLGPGHARRVAQVVEALPPGLHWVGAARFGSGLDALVSGYDEAFSRSFV